MNTGLPRREVTGPTAVERQLARYTEAPTPPDPLRSWATHVPTSFPGRLKVSAAVHNTSVQNIIREAIEEWWENHPAPDTPSVPRGRRSAG